MSFFSPGGVPNRSLAYLSGAAAASLFAGTAQAATQTVAVNVTLTGDVGGHVFALRMTSAGAMAHATYASFTAFSAAAGLTGTDALLGINAKYRTFLADFFVSAYGFGGSVVRTTDFASHMTTSNSVFSTNWFRNTMGIANSSVAPAWASGGYLGFSLTPAGSGDTYYGWVHIATMAADASSLTIDGYAWETPSGTAIHVASSSGGSGGGGGGGGGRGGGHPPTGTPEPATTGLALLALGAAGIMRHKRRRQAAR